MPDSKSPGRMVNGITFAADRAELIAAATNSHKPTTADREPAKS
jgi:hypothetical protein